ncbi:restriction endonuclease subunit S [Micromonospora rifamycinica]|uniref:restriction endonuclease subunit S n=1 Tax=Micromonospora rifamycinica TaxID=291594 RepID=UPI0033C4F54E
MTDLPDGWVQARLDDIGTWGSGGTPRAGQKEFYDGGIPWAVIGDLADGIVNTTARSISRAGLEASSAKIVPPGTILIAMYGSIGKLGVAGIPMATNQAIAFVQAWESVIDRDYLFWYLRSQRQSLIRAGKGATQQNIGQAVLRNWPILLPPLAEQRRIVAGLDNHLSLLDSMERAVTSALVKANRLRASLLAEAFVGRLVPQDPDDEPAAELLARIRAERSATIPKQRTRSRRTPKELAAPATGVTGDDYQQETLPL